MYHKGNSAGFVLFRRQPIYVRYLVEAIKVMEFKHFAVTLFDNPACTPNALVCN